MSVSATGTASNAYQYLQSLLQQGSSGSSSAGGSNAAGGNDPISQLLAAFYPSGQGPQSSSGNDQASGATGFSFQSLTMMSCQSCSGLSSGTMASLISMQGQWSQGDGVSDKAQSLFNKLDSNSDGQVSKSEFESIFGSNADMTKVDGLFNALDGNSDGSISQDELTSAAKAAHGAHHHGHGQNLADLLSASGATSQSATNSDGSTTTTISYSDGSKVTLTTPASSSSGSDSGSGTGTQSSGAGNNFLERLIQHQAELLSQSAGATASSQVAAA